MDRNKREIPKRQQVEASKERWKPREYGFLKAKFHVLRRKAGYTVSDAVDQLNKTRTESGLLGFNDMGIISDHGERCYLSKVGAKT